VQVHVRECDKQHLSTMIKIVSNYTEAHNLNKSGKVDNKKIKQGINNRDEDTSKNKQTKQTGMRNSGNRSCQNATNNQSR